jgi:hypothetical protein
VGSHDLRIELSLCDDRWIDLPARVTITRDELVPRISERLEGRIESLDASVELAGEFSFSRVCLYSFPE